LNKYAFDRVLVAEVAFASLGPNVIENEASENVEGLPWVCETTGVISKVPRGIVLLFEGRFTEEDEGPVYVELLRSFSLLPNSFVRFPSFERLGAFKQGSAAGILPCCGHRPCSAKEFPFAVATYQPGDPGQG
jgi:hypothetical protein